MSAMASQITSLSIVYSTGYSGADQAKQQSSAWLAFVRGINRCPVNSSHKWPVTRKIFPFDDITMIELQHTTAKQLVHSHYSDVKWVSKHLNPLASGRFVQQFVQTNNKGNIKTGPCEGMHRWPVGSPHKRPVMRKAFPWQVAVMYSMVVEPYLHNKQQTCR